MQHLAWLQTVTDYGKKPEDGDKKNKRSNFEMFKDSVISEFPDMSCFGYLFRLLQRIGGCTAGFSGPIPITVSDVKSWCDAIGVELFPTEIELIASLSGIYCAGLNRYKEPENPPPRAIADDGLPNFGYLGVMQQEMRKMR